MTTKFEDTREEASTGVVLERIVVRAKKGKCYECGETNHAKLIVLNGETLCKECAECGGFI